MTTVSHASPDIELLDVIETVGATWNARGYQTRRTVVILKSRYPNTFAFLERWEAGLQ